MSMTITALEMQAMRLIASAKGRGMTAHGNVIVSRQVKNLLVAGLITYASNRWAGYSLTSRGRKMVGV